MEFNFFIEENACENICKIVAILFRPNFAKLYHETLAI